MSKAMVCDECGSVLPLRDRGDSETGEEAGWLEVRTTWVRADLCTRACAIAFINSDEFVEQHDAELACITEIANTIRDASDDPSDA